MPYFSYFTLVNLLIMVGVWGMSSVLNLMELKERSVGIVLVTIFLVAGACDIAYVRSGDLGIDRNVPLSILGILVVIVTYGVAICLQIVVMKTKNKK